MTADIKYMQLAIKLAWKGIGKVWPNPMVGCVIVKNNKILGRGYHQKFGGPHAEINALADCKKNGNDPAGATMYVSLEPCCHFGKTPPCVNAIIAAGIKKVVAAVKDPTKKVAGKGFKALKKAGIAVITGVCENEAKKLKAPFFKLAQTGKPYVIVKWAQSRDDFLARSDGKRWITNAASRKDVHKLRKKAQAILVGINTVLEDNPHLTARPDTGRQPIRIVLDSCLRIPLNCNLIKTAKKTPVWIFTTVSKRDCRASLAMTRQKGVETIKVGKYKNGVNLKTVLAELGKRDVQQLLVEGGKEVITSFLKQKLADEVVIYTSDEKLTKNGEVKTSQIMKNLYTRIRKNYSDKKLFNSDVRLTSIAG